MKSFKVRFMITIAIRIVKVFKLKWWRTTFTKEKNDTKMTIMASKALPLGGPSEHNTL